MKVNVEALNALLVSNGVNIDAKQNEEQAVAVAKALKIEVPMDRENPKVVEHTTKAGNSGRYVSTDVVRYTDGSGKRRTAKGVFIPANKEVLDQTIADLMEARGLLE